jgi:hypothetical protein
VSYTCNITEQITIRKPSKEMHHITKLRTAWGLKRMTFQLLSLLPFFKTQKTVTELTVRMLCSGLMLTTDPGYEVLIAV